METSPITEDIHELRERIDHGKPVEFADPDLVKITRLRLLTDPGFPVWDVSYCYGEMRDGTPVLVNMPGYQIPKRKVTETLLAWCREARKYGKGMGLFDAISTLN